MASKDVNSHNPGPIVPAADEYSVNALELLTENVILETPVITPVVSAASDDRLHVILRDAESENLRLVILDTNAQPLGPPLAVPLDHVSDLTSCGDEQVMVGHVENESGHRVIGLDWEGHIRWQAKVAAARPQPSTWPRVLFSKSGLYLVWYTRDTGTSLFVTRLRAGAFTAPQQFMIDERIDSIDIAALEKGIVVLRTGGRPRRLELLYIADDKVQAKVRVADAEGAHSPSVGVVGQRIASLWVSAGKESVRLRWFHPNLEPDGPIEELATVSGSASLVGAKLLVGQAGPLAVAYRMEKPDLVAYEPGPDLIGQPMYTREQFLAAYDWRARKMSSPLVVQEPGSSFFSASWMQDRLIVIRGGMQAYASVYRAVMSP